MIINKTKELIRQYNISLKKAYGQNFLINPHILDIIIEKSAINHETNVLEIGAGLGSLTEALARKAKKVVSFEIDLSLKYILEDNLQAYKNISLYFCDFLEVSLAQIIQDEFNGEEFCVIANLPYYISSPILFKLLNESSITSMLLMMQKELGMRLTGIPKTKDYNALSVYMNYKTTTKIVANVSPNSFYPAPDVESVLLLVKQKKSDYTPKNEPKFLRFIEDMFKMRRKTFINNISASYPLSKEELAIILDSLGFKKTLRSEELPLEKIILLYQKIFEDDNYDS